MSTAKKKEPLEEISKVTETNTQKSKSSPIQIQQLLKGMVDNRASDLHITVDSPPVMRIHGEIVKIKLPPLTRDGAKHLLSQVLTADQKQQFEKNLQIDFSFEIKGLARFRGNIFYSMGAMSGVFRLIPGEIPRFDDLQLPQVLWEMTDVSNGLILVTGPTGSGKTTTLASLIGRLNERRRGHIITLEDPIEFVHNHQSSIVNQRELGMDAHSFQSGLKSLLRQDPDIVLVGELRDVETIEAALTIAETGHLVFATLHTNSAVQTMSRVINVFPAYQQDQIRTLLSFTLQGVVAQQLIKKSFSTGRVLALEVLMLTPGIRNLIRSNKLHQIYSQMQIGQDKTGMVTMNQSLNKLVEQKYIDKATAMGKTTMQEELSKILGISQEEDFFKG